MPAHVFDPKNPRHVAVAEYLKERAGGVERVAELLWHSVGRIWLKHDERFLTHDFARIGMIAHIADWLKVSVIDNAPWLTRVDSHGRPRKFLKFGSLEAIHAEADKQMRLRQTRQSEIDALSTDDEVLYFDLGEGWRIVRMLSAHALDRESALMQHCIGHGGYDEDLRDDAGTLLLSLRDPQGRPHATIEIENGKLVQLQGKQNTVPIEKYIKRCLPFLRSAGVDCNDSGVLVTDIAGAVYSIHDLPETLSVKGNLTIQSDSEQGVRLPRRIAVGGDIKIEATTDRLGFSSIPEALEVGRDLVIRGLWFEKLPASTKVGGSIRLDHSGISQLPANFSVAGSLSLRMAPIRILPPGLRVEKHLDLHKTQVVELPDDLRCGSIHINETGIRRFDSSVFIEKEAIGNSRSLSAAESHLAEIVGTPTFSWLDLSGSQVGVLPPGLVVTKNLMISRTSIQELPADTRIDQDLDASYCDIDIAVSNIGVSVDLTNSRVKLPVEFSCGGSLILSRATVLQMPRSVKAMTFVCRGTSQNAENSQELPEHIEAELVDVRGLPKCRLTGNIQASKLQISSDIALIGKDVRVCDVHVTVNGSLYTVPLKDTREHLELYGNLKRPPKNAKKVMNFCLIGSGGKSTIMSDMVRRWMGRGQEAGAVPHEVPIQFVHDHEILRYGP